MKIIQWFESDDDLMYCPSTDEVLFSPDMPELNEDAEALIGYWSNDDFSIPEIKDGTLKSEWDRYYAKKVSESSDDTIDEDQLITFLKGLKKNGWVVYELKGMGASVIWLVVHADTIIKEY